jgi:hypothetical protein
MIKKTAIGIAGVLGAIGTTLLTWAVHFGGPHGKLTSCITQGASVTDVITCVEGAMCSRLPEAVRPVLRGLPSRKRRRRVHFAPTDMLAWIFMLASTLPQQRVRA